MFDEDRLEVSDLAGSLVFFIRANARDSLKVLRIQSLGFCQVQFPLKLLIIIGPSEVSNIEGSFEFFFRSIY